MKDGLIAMAIFVGFTLLVVAAVFVSTAGDREHAQACADAGGRIVYFESSGDAICVSEDWVVIPVLR